MLCYYPNYEKCHTRKIVDDSDHFTCLMDKYTLCPQTESYIGAVKCCAHPDKCKFALDAYPVSGHAAH
jgi:hypothetical protein